MPDRFSDAVAAIDQFNAADPERPKELLYSRRMSDTLDRLEPNASDALKLAVRAQHIGRWKIPRSDYPMDRASYKRWRTDLAKLHSETAGTILEESGYPVETIERVQSLILKKRLKTDPEAQTLEDVACLVFLEHYFAEFADKHTDDELIRIIERTWLKMSDRGHKQALSLTLPERLARLAGQALGVGSDHSGANH